MKKLLVLVLVLSMMLSAVALGETQIEKLDVTARAENALLDTALTQLSSGMHFSDTGSVKADLEAALPGVCVYDLVISGMLALTVDGEEAADVELPADFGTPSAALFSVDGNEWAVVVPVVDGGKVVLPQMKSGIVALAAPIAAGTDNEETYDDAAYGTDNFTPSVSGKPAPSVSDAVVAVPSEEEASVSEVSLSVIVTPVAKRAQAASMQTYASLEAAYQAVMAAENVGALKTEEGTVADVLEGADQLTIRDLFNVAAMGDTMKNLYKEGATVKVTLAADAPAAVLCNHAGDVWHVVPAENVVDNGDGTITLTLEDLGNIAFLTVKADAVPADSAVTSPE